MNYSEGWEAGTPACYLDDCRTPRPNHWFSWDVIRNYDDFVNYIKRYGVPKMLSFDHDLADEHYAPEEHWGASYEAWKDAQQWKEKTGMECAKWLVEYCLDHNIQMPHFTVHSANPQGAENILSLLNNLQREQGQQPNGYRTAW